MEREKRKTGEKWKQEQDESVFLCWMCEQEEGRNKRLECTISTNWGRNKGGGTFSVMSTFKNTKPTYRAKLIARNSHQRRFTSKKQCSLQACSPQMSSEGILPKHQPPLSSPLHILWSVDDSASAMFAPECWKSCSRYMKTISLLSFFVFVFPAFTLEMMARHSLSC